MVTTYNKANKDKLEMSQHKAARFVFNNYSRYSSVMNMLYQLNWDFLEQRQTRATIIMVYKIINNIACICKLFRISPNINNQSSTKIFNYISKS